MQKHVQELGENSMANVFLTGVHRHCTAGATMRGKEKEGELNKLENKETTKYMSDTP